VSASSTRCFVSDAFRGSDRRSRVSKAELGAEPVRDRPLRARFAFNLADVFYMLGNLVLMSALIVFAIHHREQLAQPHAWERALLRHLHVDR
jgi:hypothetical protein